MGLCYFIDCFEGIINANANTFASYSVSKEHSAHTLATVNFHELELSSTVKLSAIFICTTLMNARSIA